MGQRLAALLLISCGVRGETGSKVCAGCHADIYKTYQSTGMALSSGVVTNIESEGAFTHALSGAQYRVHFANRAVSFSFELPGVHGSRRLEYFIGSGTVGRSYLYSMDGFLYQAPVSWYSARAMWDLSPGYERYDHLFLTRPVEPGCLQCHASQVQPAAGTQNGYRSPPFQEGGISCERCHGAGEEHARGRAKMLNPAKLAPSRRDSICAQCHLAGEARIARAGRDGPFRAGDLLSDSSVAFVWSGGDPDMQVTSHVERLWQSACKRMSGDRLWCGTCHDAHRAPAEAEKAAFYRSKCLGCHQTQQCNRGPDCAGCHMPKNRVRDVQHSVYSDHAIRKPGQPAIVARGERKLVPFGSAKAGDREFGLSYASIPGFEKRAIEHLERAPQDDPAVLVHLAFLYDSSGREAEAIPLYEKALKIDPGQVTAAANLASARMKRGQAHEAIRLWRDALDRSPGLENARISLAVAQYRTGDIPAAEAGLVKLLALNPANAVARKLLNEVRSKH